MAMDNKERRNILVTCGPGLVEYLMGEIEQLGFPIIDSHKGGVITKGSLIDCMKLNLYLRTAYNVLFLLKEFRCGSPEALYKQVNILPWEKIIDPDNYLCVLSRVDTYSINNSMFPNLKVKDAICDRLMKKMGTRPDSGPDRHKVVVNLFWKKENAWLYLNTSGMKISDRNYRKMPHKAPLRECLAAGLLMAAGYDGSQHLVLPMCGSGTLAIEAAMIAQNRAAGLLRSNFGFMHLLSFDEDAYKQMRVDARKMSDRKGLQKKIIATDIDPAAIKAALQNAMTAGVEHLIDFGVCDFADTEVPEGDGGIVLLNPEYGERLGETEELEKLYKWIGDFFKQSCPGYSGYIFTGNMDLAKKVGLKAARRMIFFNGNIECRLLKYELYSGTRQIDKQADVEEE
ncbi:MAG: class I SAM-dependent RNA methyltransferase [Phycisphaerae bacterium]|nr:class I SAM-dependent RNA methyltransferase [Phycisphaerae bacterium]